MTLYILDPNFTTDSGHHSDWDLMIAEVALSKGEPVTIFAHRDCRTTEAGEVRIVPWFSHTCYEHKSENPFTGGFDDFRYFNDRLADELAALPQERFQTSDCVLAPTVTEKHLLGYVGWMKSFAAATAPMFVIHLMFDCGVAAIAGSEVEIYDKQRALLYGLAFQAAAEPGAPISFSAGGLQIARDYSALTSLEIPAHPSVWVPQMPEVRPRTPRRRALLYAGDAKREKGFALVPELAAELAGRRKDWDFLIHVNDRTAWDELRSSLERLQALERDLPNLELVVGRLERAAYEKLLGEVDAIVCAYDPVAYAHKSSGLLWEAIAVGRPVLAPSNTWLTREAEAWNGGFVGYLEPTPASIAAGFDALAADLPALAAKAQKAAQAYRAANGAEALFDQFGRFWAARLSAAKLAEGLSERALPLADLEGPGWYNSESVGGETRRWTKATFEIRSEWRFRSPWRMAIDVANCQDLEQLYNLKVESLTGGDLQSDVRIVRKGGEVVVQGEPDWRNRQEIGIRIVLPWARSPQGDRRALGVQIRSLKIGPQRANEFPTASETAAMIIDTPLQLNEHGPGFYLGALTSGAAILDPGHDARFSLVFQTRGGPHVVRAISLYVNGEAAALGATGDGQGNWRVHATIPRALLTRGGFRAAWDLIRLPGEGDDEPIAVSSVRFSQFDANAPQEFAFEPIQPPAPPPPAASPGPARVREPAPQMPAAAPLEPQRIAIALIKVDEHVLLDNGYRHLDLSLYDVVAGEMVFKQIKFKICVNQSTPYLEFREAPDWPRIFRVWPGEIQDRFGSLLRTPDPQTGSLPKLTEGNDQRILAQLFDSLEAIVAVAIKTLPATQQVKADWMTIAQALAPCGAAIREAVSLEPAAAP